MSCACENKKIASELERVRRLAKTYAKMEQTIVAIFKNEDGTYGFCSEKEINKPILEYISRY